MTADMHVHTQASDGLFTPEEVVKHALSAGLSAIAVTDHDTVKNTAKLNTLCKNAQITPINGIEVSAYEGFTKVHTLGYGYDINSDSFKGFLKELYEGSLKRTEDIISKLNKCGINLSFADAAAERVYADSPIHSMHVARAAVRRGIAANPMAFFKTYLMYGRPAFSNICRPSPERAIEEITAAGGIAVIAHPGRIDLNQTDLRSLIVRLAEAGLAGIEAVYSTHTVIQTAYFKELAEELDLLVTGGSDTHFEGGNRRIGSPVFHPSEKLRQRLNF